jgi:hypothetical protein
MSTLQVVLKQKALGNEIRNVYHVAGAFATIANGQAIVNYFRTSFGQAPNNVVSALSDEWSMYEATIKDVTDPENPTIPFEFTNGVLTGGNGSADILPLQTAMLVQYKALTAPPNRSRKYLAGWTESAHGNDGWETLTKERAQGQADFLLAMPANLDSGIALVVSRFNDGILIGSNILESATVIDYARTQRRRTPGRGI